ncbi:MAG: hypothetical protein ACR2GH_18035 [Pseudonocardia sp.]
MLGLLMGMMRARAARPLLVWVVGLLIYVVAPIPQEWVLLLIVGLGAALSVTVARLREAGRDTHERAARVWNIAERITAAVEDRIRDAPPMQAPPHAEYGNAGPAALSYGPTVVYDPGALLSAVVAVLAAEGLPTNAGPALPACAQLLAWQGIGAQPGVPAPAAMALATSLPQSQQQRNRAMPAGLLAAVVRVVLTADRALPADITTDAADALIAGAEHILHALCIGLDDRATGGLQAWPVIAELIAAALLSPPADPPPAPYRYQ